MSELGIAEVEKLDLGFIKNLRCLGSDVTPWPSALSLPADSVPQEVALLAERQKYCPSVCILCLSNLQMPAQQRVQIVRALRADSALHA